MNIFADSGSRAFRLPPAEQVHRAMLAQFSLTSPGDGDDATMHHCMWGRGPFGTYFTPRVKIRSRVRVRILLAGALLLPALARAEVEPVPGLPRTDPPAVLLRLRPAAEGLRPGPFS